MHEKVFGTEQALTDSKTDPRDPIAFPVEALDLNTLQPGDTITGITKFPELKKLTRAFHDIDLERFGQYPNDIITTIDLLEKQFRAGFNGGVALGTITYLGTDTKRDVVEDRTLNGHIFGIEALASISLKKNVSDESFVLIIGTKPGRKLLVPRLFNPETNRFDSTPHSEIFEKRQKQSAGRGANELGGGRRRGNKPQGAQ